MNKELAQELLKAARSLDKQLGDVDEVVSRIPDEAERNEYRHVLTHLIDTIAMQLIFRVFREHPELDDENRMLSGA